MTQFNPKKRNLLSRGVLSLALAGLICLPVQARPSKAVQDGAHVLSNDTLAKIQQIDDEIFRATGKDLLVVTESSLNTSPQQEADNIFMRESLDGVLVLLVPSQKKLAIVPGKNTQVIFPASRLGEIRTDVMGHLKNKDLDGGMLAGAADIRTTLLASATAARAVSQPRPQPAPPRNLVRPQQNRSSGGGMAFVTFFVLIGGLVMVLFVLSKVFGGRSTTTRYRDDYEPDYVPHGGGSGPGLLGTFAAGVGGAVVGNMIYNAVTHRDEELGYRDDGYGGGGYSEPAAPAWTADDAGQAGSGDYSSYDDGGIGSSDSGGDWS